MDLYSSFADYNKNVQKTYPQYSGLLGLTINGEQRVEHLTRNGYVYFRFRDNLSEVVAAINDKVSPVYGLPVVVERRGNKWYVVGRDTDRYSDWGSSAPYLPKHGFQHSFNRDEGTGGDPVFVYPDQFMPLLVYPSGTFGAGMLQVAPYVLQRDNDFIYAGNTGTQDILPYKPTGTSAVMGLVYLDRDTGNPGILINSGSFFNASITGTAGVSPYIPYPSDSSQEPLYAFRLVSGTQSLVWDNLYNVRQFIGGGQGGGSFGITGGYMDLMTNQVAGGIKRFSDNIQIGIEPPALNTTGTVSQASEGVGAGNISWTWGTGTASFMTGIQARGSKASPLAVQAGDILYRWRGRGHDGSTYASTSVEIRGVAAENHNTFGHGTYLEMWATPTGSTTMELVATFNSDGLLGVREQLMSDRTYYVRTDGSNSNNGLANTAGGAFLTIQRAFDVIAALDFGGYTVTVQLQDATWTTGATISVPWIGGNVIIQGNSGTPANCLISVTSGHCFNITARLGNTLTIKDMELRTTTSGDCIFHQGAGTVNFTNIRFGASAGHHLRTFNPSAAIVCTGNYEITGNAIRHLLSVTGFINVSSVTVTGSSSLTFTDFVLSSRLGLIQSQSVTWSGFGSITGRRYLADTNAVLYTNGGGASYFPGSTAGTTATGGQYL